MSLSQAHQSSQRLLGSGAQVLHMHEMTLPRRPASSRR